MHADSPFHSVQYTLRDHPLCSRAVLFGGLEKETDDTPEFFRMRVQELHRAQQTGHMDVMTAGMHDAGSFTLKIQPCPLEDLERVHVGSQKYHMSVRRP